MDYDFIVVGSGIIGAATAYCLAKSKHRVLLLEQFLLPHTRGSSHGPSRLIKKGYDKRFNYGALMTENDDMWKILQTETSTDLFVDTGFLFIARPPYHVNAKRMEESLEAQNLGYKSLTADEVNHQFPMMKLDPSKGDCGVYEPTGAVIKADKALQCFLNMFRFYGGHVKDGEQVVKIRPHNSIVEIETKKAKYVCSKTIITAGPWTAKLTSQLGLDLPLQPKRIKVCYWRQLEKIHSVENGFPCFVADGLGDDLGFRNYMYGLPAMEYPQHVKICSHYGQQIDPDNRDGKVDEDIDIKDLCRFVENYFPGLENKPSIVETCIITTTPDEEFIMDKHPLYSNVIVGAGFSGRGFKFAPIVGRLLSQLAIDSTPSHNMQLFRIGRFDKTVNKQMAKL